MLTKCPLTEARHHTAGFFFAIGDSVTSGNEQSLSSESFLVTQMSADVRLSVMRASGVAALTTATATAANAGLYDQIIRAIKEPAVIISVTPGNILDHVEKVLSDPAALLHWTENEWAILHEWLRHIAVNLIHLTTGFH